MRAASCIGFLVSLSRHPTISFPGLDAVTLEPLRLAHSSSTLPRASRDDSLNPRHSDSKLFSLAGRGWPVLRPLPRLLSGSFVAHTRDAYHSPWPRGYALASLLSLPTLTRPESMDSIEPVVSLGRQVEASWSKSDYDERRFPDIAVSALRSSQLHQQISPASIVSWVLSGGELPEQADPEARFGQPPVTLYRGPRFRVIALFWVDGTTSIHQHRFSGAFQVLHGSSLHTEFGFEVERRYGTAAATGRLTRRGIRLLRQGDIQPIEAGSAYIHSVFHLERPSVTLLVRTDIDVDAQPQYSYERPSFAWDPFLTTPWALRQVQLIELYRTIGHPEFEDITIRLLNRLDCHTAYRVLCSCRSMGEPLIERLLDGARDRHRELVDVWSDVFRERRREDFVIHKRGCVTDPELRFFLALMLNASTRGEVFALTAASYQASDPVAKVIDWLRQLTNVTMKVQVAGVPWEPNLLGLPLISEGEARQLDKVLRSDTNIESENEAFIKKVRGNSVLRPLFSL